MAPLETGDGPFSALLAARALHGILWAAERAGGESSLCWNGVFTFRQLGPSKMETNWSEFREERAK